jgi:DNA polymerase-3 subunit epsilon/ATP-dependent DNA helicase DinG
LRQLVALDLETTGLDPQRDAVIEIGAVRFRGDRVEASWSSLVNPGRPLPPFITQLTGISDDMLAGAPRWAEVLGEVRSFVGIDPVLGHNVGFDLAFLRRRGLFGDNDMLDTFDLASVLLPTAGRYRLGALAESLGIPVRTQHRALEDAQTTRSVFLRLVERAHQLPWSILEEIVRQGTEIAWGAGWVFEEILKEAMKDHGRRPEPRRPFPAFTPLEARPAPLRPEPEAVPIEPEELAAVIEPGGPLARGFSGYEHRPQQVTMLRTVAQALSSGEHLLVEAGTGTGKSVAYLVPAFAWAERNGQRVVVSTNTINLQDQLIHKDIPDLNATLGSSYLAAVLKGRANYLCPRRFAGLRRAGPRTPEELRVLSKILVWLESGGSGDRGEINLLGPIEAGIWSRLSAEGEDCSPEACLQHMGGGCPYYKARLLAESAQVVIVNHALLLADVATGSRVLPDYRHLIVDEAHHLENAVTAALSFQATEADAERALREIADETSGLLARLSGISRTLGSPELASQTAAVVRLLAGQAAEAVFANRRFYEAVASLLKAAREDREVGPYGQQMRIMPSTRTLPDWSQVEVEWESLRHPLASVIATLNDVADGLGSVSDDEESPAEDLAQSIRNATRSLGEIHANLERMVFEPDPHIIYWAEVSSVQGRISLHAAPLEVGPLVERFLWHEKDSIIMTSATLTAAGEFDYLRRRLGADEAEELALGSPFDFESSTLLYLIDDIPEPSDRMGYQQAVERGLVRLCRASRGRTLALFTSYEQLRRTARAISEPLAADGILVFEQGEGASRHSLLESFRTSGQAVLLGTRSFWEGVDVPGEALSVLAIIRLPFDVPSDPIVAARSETYEDPFNEYSLPEAILRFRQGFGRLIRTKSDRGVVATFDRRILSRPYGRAFIDSLPRCTIRKGPLADLPAAASRWLGL